MTLALSMATVGGAQAATTSVQGGPTALYIVQMTDEPLAVYAGEVAGYAATKPAAGQKLDAHNAESKAYAAHLESKQNNVLRANGVDLQKTVYRYAATFNGVAVNLTAPQAQKLQHAPGVKAIFKNGTVTVNQLPVADFLGLTGPTGVWKRQFGGDGNAGNGVIIGVIDTGFWPESPSFAPLSEPRSDDAVIASKFHGTCDHGLDHPVTCNNKVIGARWFDAAQLSGDNPGEFKSPRDFDGHGSHTASTAAGGHVTNVTNGGSNLGDVEGMAPGARLSIYKALYEDSTGSFAQGSDVDIVAAIDAAVSDGVDILNYSANDNLDTFGATELAFLNAAAAGVFVSVAGGNAGPRPGSIDNAMPWATTVAAGTHSLAFPNVAVPTVAEFSSRGPAMSSGGNLLKPDIMAPGVNVVAAVSPAGHDGDLYGSESGTSMAAPHIAGIAALILSKHPDWPPMWVKSALMTSATTLDDQNKAIPGTPLDFGSGEVVPKDAFDPGLVYDTTPLDWIRFTCGVGVSFMATEGNLCEQTGAIAPNQLNYPSIAFGALVGDGTVTRTVTNATNKWDVYYADVSAPAGYKVSVSPKMLVVAPGKKATFRVTVTRTTGALGTYSFGSLTWHDPFGHKVYSPIAVQATAITVPSAVAGTGTDGSAAITVKAGYTGTLSAAVSGLVGDDVHTLSLRSDPTLFDPADPQTSPRAGVVHITVPEDTKLARVATYVADYAPTTDIDLYAYFEFEDLLIPVGQSSGGTADEAITLPGPGTYAIYVDLFNSPAADPLSVNLRSWSLPSGPAGNLTVSPANQSVTLGRPATVTATWTGLTAGRHYLGLVEFSDGTSGLDLTVVTIDS